MQVGLGKAAMAIGGYKATENDQTLMDRSPVIPTGKARGGNISCIGPQ